MEEGFVETPDLICAVGVITWPSIEIKLMFVNFTCQNRVDFDAELHECKQVMSE